MADVFTKNKRSEVMSAIRGKGDKSTEHALRRLLRAAKISGWRSNVARDRAVNRALKSMGWGVVRLWEHDLERAPTRCLGRVVASIREGGK